jgi:hypothetical protein
MTTETITRTESFECDGPVELDIRIREGRIDVHATDTSSVRVEIAPQPGELLHGADEADAQAVRETRVELHDERRTLVVRAPRGFGRSGIAVVVEAPRHSKLKAHAHRASISAAGTLSELVAATGRGSVTAEEITGPANVATGSGDVRLARVSGRLRARLGSGDFELASLEGEGARITSGRGDVWLGVVRCDAHMRTGRGDVGVAEAAVGDLTLVTGSGDIRVGLRPGTAAEVDLVSGSGRSWSELEVSDRRPAAEPAVSIRGRTGAGDAVVASAAP